MELFIYVLTLSLQLGGSVLLLISSWGNVRVKVIDDCVGGSGGLLSKNNIVDLGKEKVKGSLQAIYLNRGSFIILTFGYLLSIFNSYRVENRIFALGYVIACTAIIVFIILFIAKRVANKKVDKYSKINISELPNGTTFYEEYE